MEWTYISSATLVPLTPGEEAKDLGSIAEYIDGAMRLLEGPDWEFISHSFVDVRGHLHLSLIFRRPARG
jgi:hypothetical protein